MVGLICGSSPSVRAPLPVLPPYRGTETADQADHARQTWTGFSTVESDVAPLDIGLATAYHSA